MKTKITILDGGGAAWRARYVYVNDDQIAHIGINPSYSRPQLFGGIKGKAFRINLPHVPWRNEPTKCYLRAYKLSSWFWHNVDGRYGWGSEKGGIPLSEVFS